MYIRESELLAPLTAWYAMCTMRMVCVGDRNLGCSGFEGKPSGFSRVMIVHTHPQRSELEEQVIGLALALSVHASLPVCLTGLQSCVWRMTAQLPECWAAQSCEWTVSVTEVWETLRGKAIGGACSGRMQLDRHRVKTSAGLRHKPR